MMKKIFPFLLGVTFIITFGLEFAAEDMSEYKGTGDTTIRDEDIQNLKMDQDRSTVNQLPAVPGTAGSGAGGENKDSDTMYKDSDQTTAPIEKTPEKRENEGSGAGGWSNDPYSPGY